MYLATGSLSGTPASRRNFRSAVALATSVVPLLFMSSALPDTPRFCDLPNVPSPR